MKRFVLIAGACAAALSGCQSNPADCDPSKRTGFLATAGCMSAYGVRQDQLSSEIEAERSLNQSLQDMLESIDAEKRAVAGQRRGQEAKMASLNRSWGALKSSLDVKAQNNRNLQRQVDKLQKKMDSVNASQDMGEAEKQQRLDSLRRQVDLLMSELEAGMY
jgi:chromosome segregation ATPase